MEFVVAVSRRAKSFTDLCKEFQISCRTGYTWWNRYKADGLGGMQERSRRPHHSPRRTQKKIEQRVVELRQARPDWGARKLRKLLERGKHPFAGQHNSSDFAASRFGEGWRSPPLGHEAL